MKQIKKIVGLFLIFCIILLFSGCGKNIGSPKMYIEPARLSKSEEDIAKLLGLGDKQHMYDFVLQGEVKTMGINTYELVGGKWDKIYGGGGIDFKDTKGRIALGYDIIADGVYIAIQSNNENGSTSYTTNVDEEFSQMAIGTTRLDKQEEVVFDREIPLALQVMTSKNNIETFSADEFFEPEKLTKKGYDHVYAITVFFSKKQLVQLDMNE